MTHPSMDDITLLFIMNLLIADRKTETEFAFKLLNDMSCERHLFMVVQLTRPSLMLAQSSLPLLTLVKISIYF